MMLLPLVVSCGKESKEEASEQTYAMLEQVAELSAGGNKQAALELADSRSMVSPASCAARSVFSAYWMASAKRLLSEYSTVTQLFR